MALRFADRWIWDFWLARDGTDHHLFYLQAPRSLADPELRHWHVSIGHAVSTDLRSWQVLPDALAPATGDAWDDYTTWTGSVLRHDGRWWMFYTGTSRRERGKVQRIGLATSDDLVRWHRHGGTPLIEADRRWYELLDSGDWHEQAWRDPWVFQDPGTGVFHAMFTARTRDGAPANRGVIGHATSADLLNWTVGPPVTSPGPFVHLEIPQIERAHDAWRLLFSAPPGATPPAGVEVSATAYAVAGTHVLTASRPIGPYEWPSHRVLDADPHGGRYGGRLVADDGGGWQLLAWLGTSDDGVFRGEIDDPMPIEL